MTEKLHNIGILGTGSFLPSTIVTNVDLEKRLDTTDEWIRSRTGISERRIAGPSEGTSDLSASAALRALDAAGVSAAEIDLIVLATCTPDMPFPATSALVQSMIGAKSAACFDLNAVCSGFAYALDVGHQMLRFGAYRRALVIGADIMSRTLDWSDRSTAVLFGDGAGAVVLGETTDGGILGSALGADGAGASLLCVPGGGFLSEARSGGAQRCMVMNGREVYRFAVQVMGDAALEALEKCGVGTDEVALFIPHQANIRIIESAAKRLNLSMDRVFVNVDRTGNTSAASIAIGLDEAARSGRIRTGDIVVTVGFGAGLTWGANVIRWSTRANHAA